VESYQCQLVFNSYIYNFKNLRYGNTTNKIKRNRVCINIDINIYSIKISWYYNLVMVVDIKSNLDTSFNFYSYNNIFYLVRIKILVMNEYINTPFNYTGSKFKILNYIIPKLDFSKPFFIDLFAGGGSVYTNAVKYYKQVLVNDIIFDLISIHKLLIDNDGIIKLAQDFCPDKTDKIEFFKLRESYNNQPTPAKLWALMLSSTNNMLRFSGGNNGKPFKYNQTFGKRTWNDSTTKKVKIFTEHIRQYKDKLHFTSKHFYKIPITGNNFMFYIDSPYTGSDAGYNCYWNKDDDKKLYQYIRSIHRSGSSFMLSGIYGEHKPGIRWQLIDDLIADCYAYEFI